MTRPPSPADPLNQKISRRRLLRKFVRGCIGIGAASLGGLAYAHEIEPSWLRTSRRDLRIEGLPRALDGLTIAHLTDLHLNYWMTEERLSGVMRTTNSLGADLIVITGDFVSRDMRHRDESGRPMGDAYTKAAPGLSKALSILRAPLGVWGVLGNHDHWTADPDMSHVPRVQPAHLSAAGKGEADEAAGEGHDASGAGNIVRRLIREGGVRELDNKIAPIERNGARLWLCGVDDLWAGRPDFPGVLSQLEQQAAPSEVAILLAHEPDYADVVAQSGRISLQLSGHSHGGQVNIPFIGPPILPAMGRKYHTGLYNIPTRGRSAQSPARSSMQVFTSRGIGIVGMRLRFNCPPEIALLTLRSA